MSQRYDRVRVIFKNGDIGTFNYVKKIIVNSDNFILVFKGNYWSRFYNKEVISLDDINESEIN